MRDARAVLAFGLAGVLVLATGCVPVRMALAPDGSAAWVSLETAATPKVDESSRLYVIDLETPALRVLTPPESATASCVAPPRESMLVWSVWGEGRHWLEAVGTRGGVRLPVTSALPGGMHPWLVPTDEGQGLLLWVRLIPGRQEDMEGQWVLTDIRACSDTTPPMSEGFVAMPSQPGLARAFVALPVYHDAEEDGEDTGEAAPDDGGGGEAPAPADPRTIRVYGVRLAAEANGTEPPAGTGPHRDPVQLAEWTGDTSVAVDLVASADGGRLFAFLRRGAPGGGTTTVYALDPTGVAPPVPRFEEAYAPGPTLEAGGTSLVYRRRPSEEWLEVVERPVEGGEARVLARLPGGKETEMSTAWVTREDGTLRIVHLADGGLWRVDVSSERSGTRCAALKPERLRKLKQLADLAYLKNHVPDLEGLPPDLRMLPTSQEEATADAAAEGDEALPTPLEKAMKEAAVWTECEAIMGKPLPETDEAAITPPAVPASPESSPEGGG